MLRATSALILMLTALTLSTTSHGALIGTSSAPKQARIPVEEGRTIQIRWIISTTTAHDTGAFSAQGVLKDAATNTVLKTLTTPFNQDTGAGPLHFEEALTITAEEASHWLKMGYQQLEYSRQFSTGSERPTTSQAKVTLQLGSKGESSAGQANTPLTLHHLNLAFKPQRFRHDVATGMPLQAQLTLSYAGRGTQKGSWQIARSDPATGQLTYQTLANVSKNLAPGGRDWLLSPRLPTTEPGRYLLRFCALEAISTDASAAPCPDLERSSTLEYRVTDANAPTVVENAPATLSTDTSLAWPAVNNVVVYRLELRQLSAKEQATASEYVGTLLVNGNNTSSRLSADLIDRMAPGTTYEWSVTALDQHGEALIQTAPARFVFMP